MSHHAQFVCLIGWFCHECCGLNPCCHACIVSGLLTELSHQTFIFYHQHPVLRKQLSSGKTHFIGEKTKSHREEIAYPPMVTDMSFIGGDRHLTHLTSFPLFPCLQGMSLIMAHWASQGPHYDCLGQDLQRPMEMFIISLRRIP